MTKFAVHKSDQSQEHDWITMKTVTRHFRLHQMIQKEVMYHLNHRYMTIFAVHKADQPRQRQGIGDATPPPPPLPQPHKLQQKKSSYANIQDAGRCTVSYIEPTQPCIYKLHFMAVNMIIF